VLHLLARLEVVLARGRLRLVADAVSTTERRQCLVRERCSASDELLVHAHEVAFARVVQLEDIRAMRLGDLGAREARNGGAAAFDDAAHGGARDAERLRDASRAMPLVTQA
jgi:hypothetical protein